MQSTDFFTTKKGIAVLAFMIFIASYKGYYFAVTIFAALLLLFLAAPIIARASAKNVELGLKREICMFPGSTAKLELEIENKKLLPVVMINAAFSKDLSVSANWIRPYEKLTCMREFSIAKRGVIKPGDVSVTTSDALNLARFESVIRLNNSNGIIVYPRIISVRAEQLLRKMTALEKSKHGFTADKTLINNVASYVDGMPVKDINQRLLARTDELYVNVYEKLAMRRVCIVADFESFVTREECLGPNGTYVISKLDEEGFERLLSAIASVCIELSKKDVICTLVLPAYGKTEERIVVPETVEEQIPLLLRNLAAVEYKDEETRLSSGLLLEEIHRLGKIVVLSNGALALFKDDKLATQLGMEYLSLDELLYD